MYTYFIQSTNGGPIKIGKSKRSPNERRKENQTGNPSELVVVGVMRGDLESQQHRKWENLKTNPHTGEEYSGEWYHNSKELVSFINDKAREALHDLVPNESIDKPKVYTDEKQVVIQNKQIVHHVMIKDTFVHCDYIIDIGDKENYEYEDEVYRMTSDGWLTYMLPEDITRCLWYATDMDEKYECKDKENDDEIALIPLDYGDLDGDESEILFDQKYSNPVCQEDYMLYIVNMIEGFNHHTKECPWINKIGFNVTTHTMFIFPYDNTITEPRWDLLYKISHWMDNMNEEEEDDYKFTKDTKYSFWSGIVVFPDGYGALLHNAFQEWYDNINIYSIPSKRMDFFKMEDYFKLNNGYEECQNA